MTTTAKGLFGLKIPAGGAIIPLDIPWDVRITNIAFGEEVKGAARSVIKVHRASLPDYSDDELDEFDDDEDDEDELDEDEEEEDEDEEDAADVEEASKAVNGKKSSKKTVEEMGEEGDDDEDDEDEEDDEDSEDDDEDEQWFEEDFVICSLYPKQNEQAVVDLAFCVDEEIGFSVSGENDVELTGYYVAPDPLDVGSDSEYDEFDEYDEDGEDDFDSDDLEALYGEVEDDEDEESDDEMDDDVQIEELDAEAKALPAVAKLSKAANSKKRSNEEVEEADEAVADAAGAAVSQLTKNQRKKLNKKLKTDADANTSVDKVEVAFKDAKDGKTNVKTAEKEVVKKDGKAASKKVTLPSGLIIEDKVVGKGAQAKAGNRVGMRYVGRLTNGKQFDANTSGKPFAFKLGKGEVIAAWDEGIKGMQVGGQRRLTCPPKLAYGKAGAPPDIPSNSTLVFDVKLLEIK